MSSRRAAIATAAAWMLLLGGGCRSVGIKPFRPEPIAPVPTLAIAEMVEQHNRNAELVQSLEARPSVSDRRIGAAEGRMALVRPRDFKLTLSTLTRGVIADVGSNGDQFWIWSSQSDEKAVFVGRYDDTGLVPPEMAFQPEWVVEALGLREIPPAEVQAMTSKEGDTPGTLTLVHRRPDGRGSSLVKATVVDRATGRIREHAFYAPDGKTMVAKALPEEYQTVRLASGESVVLPDRIRLIATPPGEEPTTYTITLGSSLKINQFDTARREAVFKVPQYDGYAVVDLNERLGGARASVSSTYQTMPAPPAGGAVRLSEPTPLGRDDAALRASDPVPLSADLPAGPGAIDVVGARFPRPPGAASASTVDRTQTTGIGFGTATPR